MTRPSRLALTKLLRIILLVVIVGIGSYQSQQLRYEQQPDVAGTRQTINSSDAATALQQIEIKGRAPKTGYSRELFSSSWGVIQNCDARNYVLARDLMDISLVPDTCLVGSGTLYDPYTSSTVLFIRGPETSDDVQIDHVVSLSDAWQKGAQQLTPQERYSFANDPLNLLAVQGTANQAKGDGDAATWLPANKQYRCSYVARQIAVKTKYQLWVTQSEYDAMAKLLRECPDQSLPQ